MGQGRSHGLSPWPPRSLCMWRPRSSVVGLGLGDLCEELDAARHRGEPGHLIGDPACSTGINRVLEDAPKERVICAGRIQAWF